MKKIYISDSIKKNDIRSWGVGANVIITAPTGRGKSTIIMGDKDNGIYGLNDFAMEQGKKILFLTNRDLLKGQFKEIIKLNGDSNIKIANYQEIENAILEKLDVERFNVYDYIVIDECHYFFSDSTFNCNTDLSLKWILEQEGKTRIFMSATSDSMIRYLEDFVKLKLIKYEVDRDYSYIENLFFYEDNSVLKKMLLELPEGEKAIYFGGASTSYKISKELDNARFYCSQHNPSYSQYRDLETYEQIKNNSKFECQILCTTTVMDNGVNIIDDEVKHIIIDVFDVDTLIQCLGRKRVKYNEKVNVYIKSYTGQQINGKISYTENSLLYADVLIEKGQNYLVDKYPRKNYGKIIYEEVKGTVENGQVVKYVNNMMYIKYLTTISFCKELLENKQPNEQYPMYISDLLQFDYMYTQSLENCFDSITIENIIDTKYLEIKLFDKEQVELSEIVIQQLVSVKGVDYRTQKLKPSTLESILREQLELPYAVSKPKKEGKGEMRGKRYIVITKIKE